MKRQVECMYIEKKADTGEYDYFCTRHNKTIKHYECSSCEDCEFMPEVYVVIPVGRCDKCPKCHTERTAGAGYALDYICDAMPKGQNMITGYVEWDSEIPPVPQWCPYRKENYR